MELNNLMLVPMAKNLCRTCLGESDKMCSNIQDLIEHDMNKVKLIDILVYLNCLENNDEENWPQGICESCVSTALLAYSFKLNCLKANSTLAQLYSINSSPNALQRSDMDTIDINVVYQDHEYDVPLFSGHTGLEFGRDSPDNKELAPLPPVSEITSTEQPLRQENDKCYSCHICSRSFTRVYGLRYHMNKHADVKKYLCPKCGKGFHTSSGLKQHIQSHKEIGQFKCGFCNKNYKSRQSLREHFRVAHSSNRHSFVCTLCGKRFTAKSTLIMHMKSHNSVKQFACTDCPKSYTRASYLKLHRLSHMGVERPRPFTCKHQDCGRTFSSKYSMMVHAAHSHSSEQRFKCEICAKSFATTGGLRVHKESHKPKPKDLSCEVCGKLMSSKRVLQKHMRAHEEHSTDMFLETVINNGFFDHIY